MQDQSLESTSIKRFINEETIGGLILIACIIVAMIWANSGFYDLYQYIWYDIKVGFVLGNIDMVSSLHHWINDGLMAVFFFTIGLEIKREIMDGELSSMKKASLPIAAAFGGMVVPAVLYTLVAAQNPEYLDGWGIPMATDIAFALGLMAMLGKKVNVNLKIFLMALAIADDLGAVMVIAIFYTETIDYLELLTGGGFILVLMAANYLGVRRTLFYGLVGFLGVWIAFIYSGVHATIAGVLIAFTIPARTKIGRMDFVEKLCALSADLARDTPSKSKLLTQNQVKKLAEIEDLSDKAHTPLQQLEHSLHPLTIYFILPIFALSNAGIRIEGSLMEMIIHPISIGIIIGLVLGKSIGVSLVSGLMVRFKLATLPEGVTFREIIGVSFMSGIGFTMSIFISELAFSEGEYKQIAKVGIFLASIIAAVIGMAILSSGKRKAE
ncbi:MAG: Na+/H+ antiporter NhaA [Bacteroidota bacterium]|nr:Na+/H+ antiporter NhaA [Bacteroidota bacterium]